MHTYDLPWERYLQKNYFDPSHPSIFKVPKKLYQVIKQEGKFSISLPKIKKWLKDRESFSLHKPV